MHLVRRDVVERFGPFQGIDDGERHDTSHGSGLVRRVHRQMVVVEKILFRQHHELRARVAYQGEKALVELLLLRQPIQDTVVEKLAKPQMYTRFGDVAIGIGGVPLIGK
ncbi:hypothetical protein D3C85_1226280 [compost metagenome]